MSNSRSFMEKIFGTNKTNKVSPKETPAQTAEYQQPTSVASAVPAATAKVKPAPTTDKTRLKKLPSKGYGSLDGDANEQRDYPRIRF